MLVLSRKECEQIVIGGRITLQVLRIAGGQVRLGVTAPAEIGILRGELLPREDERELGAE